MQVSISNTQGLERQVTVTLPSQQIEDEVRKRLGRLRKTAKLPGFRPGKIPASVIDKKFGEGILNEVAHEMINSSYVKAITEKEIEPATRPVITPKDISRGRDVEYTAIFDVFPDIQKTDLSGVSIEKKVCTINEADIDATLETIKKQKLTWNTVQEEAQRGDQVIIDFKGSVNGEEFEGGQAQDYSVVIGEGALLKDFEDGLVGMSAQDTKIIDVVFPEDYSAQNLKGSTAQFEITAKQVSKSQLPEVDEAFLKEFGVEDGNIQAFRNQIKENMERELKIRINAASRENVLKALADSNEVQLPSQLVEEESGHILKANRDQLKKQGIDESQVKANHDKIKEEAGRRVKLSMIVRQVMIKNEIRLDKEIIDARLQEMAANYEDKKAYINWYVQDKERMAQLESAALEQLVVDKMIATADVVEKEIAFKDLMDVK